MKKSSGKGMKQKLAEKTGQIEAAVKSAEKRPRTISFGEKANTAPGKAVATFSTNLDNLIKEKDAEIEKLKEELKALTGATGESAKVPLHLIDESPYQPRLKINQDGIVTLSMTMDTAGQTEKILLRPKQSGRFELVKGHRRYHSAKYLKWDDIEADIKKMSDAEARKVAVLSNVGREDLSHYEYALLFREGLKDKEVFKNQSECARYYGFTQSVVSNCLRMLDLPDEFQNVIKDEPHKFGFHTSNNVHELLKEYPKDKSIILLGLERIRDGAEQSSFKGWVKQQLAKAPSRNKRTKPFTITNKSGQTAVQIQVKDREVVLKLRDIELSAEEIGKKVYEFMKNAN